MENFKTSGDKEEEGHKSKPPASEDGKKSPRKLMVKIPTKCLSERQKKILCNKSVPSTSSTIYKEEWIFKAPQSPPLKKKKISPTKATRNNPSLSSSPTMVQTAKNVLSQGLTTKMHVGQDAPSEESTIMGHDEEYKNKPPASTEAQESPRKLMVKIPVEILSERQKKIFCKKPVPSTSSTKYKEESVFKAPESPPLKKKKLSPIKATRNNLRLSSSTTMVQMAENERSKELTAKMHVSQDGPSEESAVRGHDEEHKNKPPVSVEVQEYPSKLMVKIPTEFLSERQKEILSQKPVPSTSSAKYEEESVFNAPQSPPLKNKKLSPTKATGNNPSSPTMVQTAENVLSQKLTTKMLEGQDAPSEESTIMVHGEEFKSKLPVSTEAQEAPRKLMVKIPTEFLSERQKETLCQKPVPSTPSAKYEEESVFKVPQSPPLKKKRLSPTKATGNNPSLSSSPTMVQTAENVLSQELTTKMHVGQYASSKESAIMVQTCNDEHKNMPPASEERQKSPSKLMVKIPTEFLSERQKKILCHKSVPSTSSTIYEEESVFKAPQSPPLKKKKISPTKATRNIPSLSSSPTMVQTAENVLSQELTTKMLEGQDAPSEESTIMVHGEEYKNKLPVSTEAPRKLMVKIPIQHLSERQKKLLSHKPVPSTSSAKTEEEMVLTVPQSPPFKKKKTSPIKSSRKNTSLCLSKSMVNMTENVHSKESTTMEEMGQDALSKELTALEKEDQDPTF